MLDVQQIFGRAGRPQFEDTGLGIIITSHDKLVGSSAALHPGSVANQHRTPPTVGSSIGFNIICGYW